MSHSFRQSIALQVLFLLVLAACASSSTRTLSSGAQNPASIVFLSDFGALDESVAVCKGEMLRVEASLNIVDLTHQVPAFSVRDAARLLAITAPHFTSETVFLGLVDQHTEGPKRSLVLRTKKNQYFLAPDNGLLSLVMENEGVSEVREIGKSTWVSEAALASPFVGRDVFAVVAAHLARGEDFKTVGPVVTNAKKLPFRRSEVSEKRILGEVVALDGPFGNLITNVTSAHFLSAGYNLGETVSLELAGKKMMLPFVKTFDDVPLNELLLYVDSTGHVAIAVNQGNFAKRFKIQPPAKLIIYRKGTSR